MQLEVKLRAKDAVVWRGTGVLPSGVKRSSNSSIDADVQAKTAASQWCLAAGHLQRYVSHHPWTS